MPKGLIRGMLWGVGASFGLVTLLSLMDGAVSNHVAARLAVPEKPDSLEVSVADDQMTSVAALPQEAPVPDTLATSVAEALSTAAIPQTGGATELASAQAPQTGALAGISAPDTQAPEVSYGDTASLMTPATEPSFSVSADPEQPPAPDPTPQATAFASPDTDGTDLNAADGDLATDEDAKDASPVDVSDLTPDAETDVAAAAVPQETSEEPDMATEPVVNASISLDPVQPAAPSAQVETGGFGSQPQTDESTFEPADSPQQDPKPLESEQVAALVPAAPEEADLIHPAPATVVATAPDQPGQYSLAVQTSTPGASPEALAPATAPLVVLADPARPGDAPEDKDSAAAQVRAGQEVADLSLSSEPDVNSPSVVQIAPTPTAPADILPLPAVSAADTTTSVIAQATVTSDADATSDDTPVTPAPVRSANNTVKVNRLPTLTAPQPPADTTDTETEVTTEEAEGVEEPQGEAIAVDPEAPPVQRFASAFENPEGKPIMAVVLLDDASSSDSQPDFEALRELPYAVSFAVDALHPDAEKRSDMYRSEGFEVLATVDLPEGSTARDAEVNLAVALDAMPQAVAVLEGLETGVQTTPEAGRQVAQILAQTGHGFVTQNRGLNTVQKLAAREGVPSGVVFRDFDAKGQSATVIRRFLDQAAFRAGQEGQVIMLGRLREETVAALVLWALQDRASTVAMAPVSAALRAQ